MFHPVLAQTYSDSLLRYYLDQLQTPAGLMAVIAAVAVAVAVLIYDPLKWWLISVSIAFGCCAIARGELIADLPQPFKAISAVSQGIIMAAVVLLVIPAVRPQGRVRAKLVHLATPLLILFQLVIAGRQIASGTFAVRAFFTIPVYLGMFFILGLGMSRWLSSPAQVRRLVAAVSWSAVLLVGSSIFVLLVKPLSAVAAGRLYGISSNPNRLAGTVALTLPFSLALFHDRRTARLGRAFYATVAATSVLTVAGTGSRLGSLLMVIAFVLFYRTRLGSLALGGAVLAAIGLAMYAAVGPELAAGQDRLTSTQDTRSEVWGTLLSSFRDSPLVGVARDGAQESSYLTIAAGWGVLGLIPCGMLLLAFGRAGRDALRMRSELGDYAVIADLLLASIVQFVAAWAFEGFLLGTITDHTITLYCLLGVMGVLAEQAHLWRAGRLADDDHPFARNGADTADAAGWPGTAEQASPAA